MFARNSVRSVYRRDAVDQFQAAKQESSFTSNRTASDMNASFSHFQNSRNKQAPPIA